MMCQALEQFEQEHGFKFKKITRVPLEGDGTIERKVSKYVWASMLTPRPMLTKASMCPVGFTITCCPTKIGWKISMLQTQSLWLRTPKDAL